MLALGLSTSFQWSCFSGLRDMGHDRLEATGGAGESGDDIRIETITEEREELAADTIAGIASISIALIRLRISISCCSLSTVQKFVRNILLTAFILDRLVIIKEKCSAPVVKKPVKFFSVEKMTVCNSVSFEMICLRRFHRDKKFHLSRCGSLSYCEDRN